MLKALFPIIGLTFAFAANADSNGSMMAMKPYTGPMPGDIALSREMCDEVCDMALTSSDDNRMACHDLCSEMGDCTANHSTNTADMRDCTSNANRKYAMRLKGQDVMAASANSEADRPVVTDADNFEASFEEDDSKGFRDHR